MSYKSKPYKPKSFRSASTVLSASPTQSQSLEKNQQPVGTNLSRRKLLAGSGVAAGAVVAAQTEWAKPLISSVVLPAHAQTSMQTIAEIAGATEVVSTLFSVLTDAQASALSGPGPLTVFAPTNQAFTNIQATVDTLSAAEVAAVVDYHVLSGDQPFSALPATTGTSPSLVTTVQASNGVIYVISEVLLPPS